MASKEHIEKTYNSGDGERRAMVGYKAQYQLFAELIYEALFNGKLEWIGIADPGAGQVDDIQIACQGCLDAYQVKWGENIQLISFNDLIADERKKEKIKPNLIRQLADGWKLFSSKYPERKITVHLIHRSVPSPNKSNIPVDEQPPLNPTFQGFLNTCWKNKDWINNGYPGIPNGWKSAMNDIKKSTGLNDSEFLNFCRDCELQFNYQLNGDMSNPSQDEMRRSQDIEQILGLLIKIAGNDKRDIHISCEELLERLNWEERFKLKFTHKFWVDEKLYQPISSTITALEKNLELFDSGYLALIGAPGSGKSTTLTQTFRYRKGFRIIHYYAFVPDDTKMGRGEAVNFLHDLYLSLKENGIQGEGKEQPKSRGELQSCISSQLNELGKRWLEEGIRTIILVDGLDHIEREQQPERTLLKDLPLPDMIPNGVIFLLGSQKIDLDGLSSRIRVQLNEDGRTITISPLDRRAVFSIIEASSLSISLQESTKEKILHLSEGHPLSLSYLLQKIQNITEEEQFNTVLNEVTPYKGNIEQNYEVYWKGLKSEEIRKLLGYISRLRGVIDLNEVIKWMEDSVVEQFIKTACHFFRKKTETHWHFFHNSFRQFILAKTGRNIFSVPDEKRDQEYHNQLAQYAANAPTNTPWSWEELYHRACAGDNNAVIKLGSQDRFRKQFYAFRPLTDIIDDISLCLKAAKEEMDGLAIIRAFLIEKELRDRDANLRDAADMPLLLFKVYGLERAIEYVIRGQKLHVSDICALDFCDELITIGEIEKARPIFDAAEPLSILNGSSGVEFHASDMEKVMKWTKIAHHFRPFEKILQAIDQLRIDTKHPAFKENIDENNEIIHRNALFTLVDAIAKSADKLKIEILREILINRGDSRGTLIRLDFWICAHSNDKIESINALHRITEWFEKQPINNNEKIFIAESYIHLKNDTVKAYELINNIPQPPLVNDLQHYKKDLSQFEERMNLNRILSALGSPVNPISAVPDISNERQHGIVLFERMLVIISNLWGCAWRKEKLDIPELLRQLYPAMNFFNRDVEETKDWRWHQLEARAQAYFTFMINAVTAHGKDAVVEIGRAFEKQWSNEQTRRFWSTAWKRHISLELYRAGDSLDSFIKRLDSIEMNMTQWDNLEEGLQNHAEQALAWVKTGKTERAISLIPRMLEISFGIIYEKDPQFYTWVEWLKKANTEGIPGIEERIRRFSAAYSFLINSNHDEYSDAGKELIETTASWNPAYAVNLLSWLMDRRAIHFTTGIEGMIAATLNSPNPPIEIVFTIVKHLIIPFQSYVSENLPLLLTSKNLKIRSTTEINKLMETLLTAIETKSYPSERRKWIKGLLEGGRQTGIDISLIKSKFNEIDNEENKYNSYEEMIDFLNSIKEDKYFSWDSLISKIVYILDENQIKNLNEKLKKFKPGSLTLSIFAERLSCLGCTDDALIFAEQALSESSSYGWYTRSDGGTRIKAVQCLIKVDPRIYRKKAFSLVEDYLSEIRDPGALLNDLDELVPVLFESPPLDKIWIELKEHIYQLSDFSNVEEYPPVFIENSLPISHSEMLIEVLSIALLIPISEMRQEVHKALCEIIINRWADKFIAAKLNHLLKKEEDLQGRVLAILESTFSLRRDFVEQFSNEISHLCISPNLLIRQMAHELAVRLKIEPKLINKNRQEITLTYRLTLPEIPLRSWSIPFEAIPPGEPFPDSNDPLEVIRPLQHYFETLSELSKIPFQNLIARARNLMETLSKPEKWNKQAEEKLRWWLISANLELPFIRPRPSLVARAYAYILAELSDAGILHNESLSLFLKELRFHDPTLSLKEPLKRPQEIIIPEKDMAPHPINEWLNIKPEDFLLMIDKLDDGRVILGQLTHIIKLEWEAQIEYRFSQVYNPSWSSPSNVDCPSLFFNSSENWYGFEYLFIEDALKPSKPILYGNLFNIELRTKECLAINPQIPLNVGWELDNSGLFRWIDKKGNIMIESIMWQDGPPEKIRRPSEVCSKGWLVVATPAAIKNLRKIMSPAISLEAIVRQYNSPNGIRQAYKFALNRRPHSAFPSNT